jgi:hypothetical protein
MHLIDQELNLMVQGRIDEAWKLAEILENDFPYNPRAKFNRGWFLIHQGKFQEGYQLLEDGRQLNTYGGEPLNTNKPIWDGIQDLKGKVVVILTEGGYGDIFTMVRFANEIYKRGGTCIMCCDPTIHSLLLRVPGVHSCVTLYDIPFIQFDFWIPSFSCSWLFGHTAETLPNEPYIFAKPESVDIWKTFLRTDKPKVGIRWSGSPKFEHQQFRLFPPKYLTDLHEKFSHLQFYSLQRDNDIIELPSPISDIQDLLISWEDTAACIQNLDLVITSCTSIAHLSSAMGKPTFVIVPILPYHTWAYGGDHSCWYQKSTKVFRQKKLGSWDEPFKQVEEDLRLFFSPNK